MKRLAALFLCLGMISGCQSPKPEPVSSTSGEIMQFSSVGEAKIVESSIGYISIKQFGDEAGKEVVEAMAQLKEQHMNHWILDLRGNWGGSLKGGVAVAELFCPKGAKLGRYHDPDGSMRDLQNSGEGTSQPPSVILVDQATASTSEWVAGTLNHFLKMEMIGQPTYGKSRVQQVSQVDAKRLSIVTLGEIDLPSGRPVEERGLQPRRVAGREEQLQSAIKAIRSVKL